MLFGRKDGGQIFILDISTYSAGNEQLNINATPYEYDANGNRTRKTESGVVTTYVYDDENRLIKVTRGANVLTYTYDPFGRRIEKNVNGAITQYVYDNEDIIMEYDGSNNLKTQWGTYLNISIDMF